MFKTLKDELIFWCDAFLGFIPGRLGNAARRLWFQRRFNKGNKLGIEAGCEFIFPRNMSFGEMVGIGRNSFFTAEDGFIEVGANTSFNRSVHINAAVGGTISIGEGCLIGPNVIMRTSDHRYDNPHIFIRQQGHITGNINIQDDVWIGAHAVILGGVHIGKGAVIGAGAVVTKDVPDMVVVAGVPAKIIGFRDKESIGNS